MRRSPDPGARGASFELASGSCRTPRQFIESVTTDTRAAAVVRAAIDLTHTLGLTVVAEGVEDADTATWLREQGCDVGQGYHFGFPVGAADVPKLVAASRL